MRRSEPLLFLSALFLVTSCGLAQSSESNGGLDTPIPFPDRSDKDFPQQLDTDSDGRPDFYIQMSAIGNEDTTITYLYLQSRGENSYLNSEDTDTESYYFDQGMEVGPYPQHVENPLAPITWSSTSFSVCEVRRRSWYCGVLETEKKYLGLKLNRQGETYYGWMLIGANPKEGSEILIYDFEFSSKADKPIMTGEHP
jgi:hypothetical protein